MATDSWDEFPTSPPPAATPAGMVTPGNINLDERPVVHNEDGTISTVKSLGIGVDGKEVLIPTVAEDGSRILSHDEAIAQYHETGHHLGIFDTPENATAYGKAVSAEQDKKYNWDEFSTTAPKGSDWTEFATTPPPASNESWDEFKRAPVQGEMPARAMAYGDIVGEHTRATMEGPLGTLGTRDVALSPNMFQQNGGQYQLGQIVNVHKGDELVGQYRVGDYSYIKPGVPTFNTIELRDRDISGSNVTVSPADHVRSDMFDPGQALPPQEPDAAPEQPRAAPPEPQVAQPGVDIGVTPAAPVAERPTFTFKPRSGMQTDYDMARQAAQEGAVVQLPRALIKQDDPITQKITKAAYNTVAGFAEGMESPEGTISMLNPFVGVATIGAVVPQLIQQVQAAEKTPPNSPERWQAGANVTAFLAAPAVLHAIAKARTNLPTTEQGGITSEPSARVDRQSAPPPVADLPDAFPTTATAESVGNLEAPPASAPGHLGIAPPGTRLIQRAIERTRIPRKRSQLDAATGERSARLQVSNAEAERTHNEIRLVARNERAGNAMSIYREAGGDDNLLQQWIAQAKQTWFKQAATDALNLTPEQKAVVAKAASTFDALEVRGNKYDILTAHRDNYVPHVWEVENKMTGLGASRLKDRFKFNKARSFDTFFDGDQAGFKPKTFDLANLLPAYMEEMNRVIADRQFVQGVSGSKGTDARPLVAPQGNAKVVDSTDYIVRNADGSPLPKFQKARYDTIQEAQAALKPGQTIETRASSSAMVNPHGFAPLKDAKGEPIDTSDYVAPGDQPALHNWRWVATDERGNTTILKSDLAFHPELARRIKAAMGQSALRKWYNEPVSPGRSPIPRAIAKNLDTAQAVMKREMFSLGGMFHQVQEATHGIGHTVNPFGGLQDMSRPTAPIIDAMQNGLMLRSEKGGASRYMEGIGGRDSFITQLVKKFGGRAGQAVADVVNGYQDYLFNQYIPALKFKTYEHALERNMNRFAPELKSGEVTSGDIKQMTAEQVNAAYGHLNHALLDTDPTMQHMKQLVLLAPDFLEARGRFAGQAAKGVLGGKVGREQLRAVGVLALTQAGAAYTLSQLIPGGKWDPKRPFELNVSGRTYSLRSVPEDLFRLLAEGPDARREFISGRINPLLQKSGQAISGRNYRGEKVGFMDTVGEAIANYIPIIGRSIPGIRNLTETGRNSPISPLQQLSGSLGLRISRYSPITKTYQLSSQWQKDQGLPLDTGVYPVSKYQQLRYALEDGDMEKANAQYRKLIDSGMNPGKVREGFRDSLFKPFTGTKQSDAKFQKSLTGDDLQTYNEAALRRKAIAHSFLFVR